MNALGSTCVLSISGSILLTIVYVSSLYVWRTNLSRDHPSTIKRRFFSVICVMIIAPFFCIFFINEPTVGTSDLYEHLGIRWPGFWSAIFWPQLLTWTLFLGPLTMQFMSGNWKVYLEPMYWVSSFQDLVWLRNHVMAPLSEEWVFRACMMPLLLQCLNPMTAVFLGPFLFGVAHFHHMLEQIKAGFNFKTALLLSSFQFMYTTIFGAYSAYLFIRTGHFIAPFLAHIFCNHMGFPNFGEIFHFPLLKRTVIITNFILGFTLWCYFLTSMTNPELYDNMLYLESETKVPYITNLQAYIKDTYQLFHYYVGIGYTEDHVGEFK